MIMIFASILLSFMIPYIVESQQLASTRRINSFGEFITLFVAHSFIMFNMVSVE